MSTEHQTIAEQFPWATVGATAYIYNNNGWGYIECRKVTVTKVTKARITVTGDRVFYTRKCANELREYGIDWYRSAQLIPADDPLVAEARETIRKKNAENKARAGVDSFNKYRTVDNAHKAVAALLDYIEAHKEEGK